MQELPHIDGETPQHWPKRMPFRIPADYFISQRREIIKLLQHQWNGHPQETVVKELDRLSPLLGELKRKGVNGRWNQSLPVQDKNPAEKHETETPKTEKRQVINFKKYWGWVAAAAITGLLFMVRSITEQSQVGTITTKDNASYGVISDATGISDEDIKTYLSENADIPAENDLSPSNSSTPTPEPFLANADLLSTPEVFTTRMNAIPVHELEAYINDIPSINK